MEAKRNGCDFESKDMPSPKGDEDQVGQQEDGVEKVSSDEQQLESTCPANKSAPEGKPNTCETGRLQCEKIAAPNDPLDELVNGVNAILLDEPRAPLLLPRGPPHGRPDHTQSLAHDNTALTEFPGNREYNDRAIPQGTVLLETPSNAMLAHICHLISSPLYEEVKKVYQSEVEQSVVPCSISSTEVHKQTGNHTTHIEDASCLDVMPTTLHVPQPNPLPPECDPSFGSAQVHQTPLGLPDSVCSHSDIPRAPQPRWPPVEPFISSASQQLLKTEMPYPNSHNPHDPLLAHINPILPEKTMAPDASLCLPSGTLKTPDFQRNDQRTPKRNEDHFPMNPASHVGTASSCALYSQWSNGSGNGPSESSNVSIHAPQVPISTVNSNVLTPTSSHRVSDAAGPDNITSHISAMQDTVTGGRPTHRPMCMPGPTKGFSLPSWKSTPSCSQGSAMSLPSHHGPRYLPWRPPMLAGGVTGDVWKARRLLMARRKVADIRTEHLPKQDADGDTILHLTICGEDCSMLRAILERLDRERLIHIIDWCNSLGQSPLYMAAAANRPSMVKELVSFGANPNLRAQLRKEVKTAIHCAAQGGHLFIDTLRELLQARNINLNIANSEGLTALHCAIQEHGKMEGGVTKNSVPTIETLLMARADPNAKDTKSGKTPLMYAIETKDYNLVNTMVQLIGRDRLRNMLKTQTLDGSTCSKICAGLRMDSDPEGWKKINLLLFSSD